MFFLLGLWGQAHSATQETMRSEANSCEGLRCSMCWTSLIVSPIVCDSELKVPTCCVVCCVSYVVVSCVMCYVLCVALYHCVAVLFVCCAVCCVCCVLCVVCCVIVFYAILLHVVCCVVLCCELCAVYCELWVVFCVLFWVLCVVVLCVVYRVLLFTNRSSS